MVSTRSRRTGSNTNAQPSGNEHVMSGSTGSMNPRCEAPRPQTPRPKTLKYTIELATPIQDTRPTVQLSSPEPAVKSPYVASKGVADNGSLIIVRQPSACLTRAKDSQRPSRAAARKALADISNLSKLYPYDNELAPPTKKRAAENALQSTKSAAKPPRASGRTPGAV